MNGLRCGLLLIPFRQFGILQKATGLQIVDLQASNVDDYWQRSTIEHRWQK